MIPAAAASDAKPQQQQQQQQQLMSQNQAATDDYYSDWTGNQEATSDESEHSINKLIDGHAMTDDVNTIDRQVSSLPFKARSVIMWLHFECPAPYRPNPPFLISDIRALWRSVLSARVPECQKLKMVG